MFTEYHTHEMVTLTERILRNALKIGTSREVDSKEGVATAEGLLIAPRNCSEVWSLQVELNGAVGEALIQQPPMQVVRTKLFFDIFFNDQFLD